MEKSVSYVFDKISLEKNSAKFINQTGLKHVIRFIKQKARIVDTIAQVYRPFIYDYNYTFKCDNLMAHNVIEEEFSYTPSNIEWDKYWHEIHLPGLKRWCMPQIKSLTGEKK